MALSLAKALTYPPLNQCRVVGGADGLYRLVNSVNIISAPDFGPWMKNGDLLFTAGYILKDNVDDQIRLIRYLDGQGCAGLAIKFKRYFTEPSEHMIKEANDLNFPLIEIPNDLSLSEILPSLIKEIANARRNENEKFRSSAFLLRIMSGEEQGEDSILAAGLPFGLLPNCDYTVLNISFNSLQEEDNLGLKMAIDSFSQEIAATMGVKILTAETDDVILLVQEFRRRNASSLESLVREIAELLSERLKRQCPSNSLFIGIGNRQKEVLGISRSYKEAREAIFLGRRISHEKNGLIFEYKELEVYAFLQNLPVRFRQRFVTSNLGKLLDYDKQDDLDLLHTLEVYLQCGGRNTECAKRLHIHRNTVVFRLTRIKELLGVDLDDGETAFRLQLALHVAKLAD